VKSIFVIICLSGLLSSLYAQDIAELDRRNGFKSIKLGSSIDSLEGAVFKKEIKERKEFPAKLYEVKSIDYKAIGGIPIKKVELKTYNGLIYEIHVYFPKDPRVMQSLEKSFGEAIYSIRMSSYYWKAETLSLIFKGEGKQVHITYRSGPILRMMYADKNQKAEDLSQEF
jgi:hypothetical protein